MTTPPTPVRMSDLESSLKQARAITTLLEESARVAAYLESDIAGGRMDAAREHARELSRLQVALLTLNRSLIDRREGHMERFRSGMTTIVASLA